MAMTEARKKWEKENTRRLALKFNCHTDADIIEFLDKQDNKQLAIKLLIRDRIRRDGSQQ